MFGSEKDLYEGAVYPQGVQRKWGESSGESHVYCNSIIQIQIMHFLIEKPGTRRMVWGPKCTLCTIEFRPILVSNRTGQRDVDRKDRVPHPTKERKTELQGGIQSSKWGTGIEER
jgi:hypothetical protein